MRKWFYIAIIAQRATAVKLRKTETNARFWVKNTIDTAHLVCYNKAAKCGAHIATVPYKVILQMIKHPLTDIGIQKFMADWQNAFQK